MCESETNIYIEEHYKSEEEGIYKLISANLISNCNRNVAGVARIVLIKQICIFMLRLKI